MKFIISENRLVSMVFKYLDNQDFIVKKQKDNNVVFLNSENDDKAIMTLNMRYDKVGISEQFISEISTFFSMRRREAEKLIGEWVCNKLQVEPKSTIGLPFILVLPLENEE